jgi:hypothetical protein
MPHRLPYAPYPRGCRPLGAREARARRRAAGRVAWWCAVLAALVLIAASVDWTGLERRAFDALREGAREAAADRPDVGAGHPERLARSPCRPGP